MLSIAQRKMESVSLRDKISNRTLREKSLVKDVITHIITLKWNWAGHVCAKRIL